MRANTLRNYSGAGQIIGAGRDNLVGKSHRNAPKHDDLRRKFPRQVFHPDHRLQSEPEMHVRRMGRMRSSSNCSPQAAARLRNDHTVESYRQEYGSPDRISSHWTSPVKPRLPIHTIYYGGAALLSCLNNGCLLCGLES